MRCNDFRPTVASIFAQSRYFERELAVAAVHQPKLLLPVAQPTHSVTFSRSENCSLCVYVSPADHCHESAISSSERRIDARLLALCFPSSLSSRFESDFCFLNHQSAVLTENRRLVYRSSQTTRLTLSARPIRFSASLTLVAPIRLSPAELLAHGNLLPLENRAKIACTARYRSINGALSTRWRSSAPCRGASSTDRSVPLCTDKGK